jgi:flagellar basal body-associated protein FliL
MKLIPDNASRAETIFFTALLSLAGALIALLLIGTIFGLVRSPAAGPVLKLGKSEKTETLTTSRITENDDIRVFSGLGRLRIPLTSSSTLILSISFPYLANDIAFTEELAAKIADFRKIASDYFSSLPAEKTIQIDEETAKTEILSLYNASLRLGRIETLYFSDMMIVD